MKTVSGVVLSSKPVSLSKAAKILSKFAASDNGASPAYAYYLNSASESFDELVQLHKELRGADSERRSKKRRSGIRDEVEEPVNSIRNYGEDDEIKENGVAIGKKDVKEKKSGADAKKKKSTRDENVERRSHGNSDALENGVGGKKREKEAKQVKKEVIEEGRSNGVSKVENREEKRSKKRKSEEIASANGEVNDSAEKLVQHKKRKKSKIGVEN